MPRNNYRDEAYIVANQNIREREYWRKQCSGNFVRNSFPHDFKKDSRQFQGKDEIKDIWDSRLFQNLMKLSGGIDVKLHMILAAGLNALLYIYTGNVDVSLGSPVLRQEAGGELINKILLYRTWLRPGMSFKELLLAVRETIIQAAENQNFPLDLLPEILEMPAADKEFPLFTVALVLENIHDKDYLQEIDYSVLFSFHKGEETLDVTVRYMPWLYRRESIQGITGHLKTLFSRVLSELDRPLAGLDVLSQEEKQQLLIEFNNKHMERSPSEVTGSLFERQAAETPHHEAVVLEDPESGENSHLLYRELNEKANRLARYLREQGVSPDSLAAVMLERSPQLVTAILAIIKAGGAYLPIDPNYPKERINFMLGDSRTAILITQNRLLGGVNFEGRIVPCEEDDYSRYEGGNLPLVNLPHHLVYVIYTSGSTGKPKGVMVQHDNFVNAALGWRREYRLDTMEVNLLQMASFSFDVSCGDMARALLNGGKMVITPEAGLEPEFLFRLLVKYRISLFESTPSFIFPFMQYLDDNRCEVPDLKLLIVGSDTCPVEEFNRMLKKYGKQMRIINSYGVTEATIDSSYYEGNPEKEGITGIVPIGKPMPNIGFYILDTQGRLLPMGVPGELYIGGSGVTRGYMNRPQLTRSKFIQTPVHMGIRSPARPFPPSILYRTGDLARWLPGGNLLFLGRKDFQVKIRGFRIELGEVESRVSGHPSIKTAAVIERQDGTGEKYLCAYFVPRDSSGEGGLSAAVWRDYLAEKLPDYMIPGQFVSLEKMPLNANGKLDRKALPEPGFGGSTKYEPPRSEVEKKMVELWGQVLFGTAPLETPIGIDDNFFELGGQSLKATVLVYRIHKEFQIKLPLVQVFKTPTVRGLSQYIHSENKEDFITVNPMEKRDYYPLSPAQKRLYIMQQSQPHSVFYNIPLAVKILGDYSRERMTAAFNQLIRRHETLRTSFTLVGNEPVQQIHEGVAFEIFHQPVTVEGAVSGPGAHHLKDAVERFIRPFNLSQPPLFRAGLITAKEGERSFSILIVDLHHIISDGMSNGILIEDFQLFYSGGHADPLRLQYKDAAQWQINRLRLGEAKKQEEYWLREFSGPLPRLELPFDVPRAQVSENIGSMIRFDWSGNLPLRLRKLAATEQVTMYTLILTLYILLLFKLSGQEDIVVGTTALGRRHADLETVIGMFVNTLALRNYPREDMTFKEFLQTVNRRTLEALENQDYQFEDLVEKVLPTREPGSNPLFDVMFSYSQRETPVRNGTRTQEDELKTVPFDISGDEGIVKFDLVLDVSESPDVIYFVFAFSISLFKTETLRRYSDYLKELTLEVLSNPELKLGEIAVSFDLEQSSPDIYKEVSGDFEF